MIQLRQSAFVSLAACVLLAACSATAAAPSPAPSTAPSPSASVVPPSAAPPSPTPSPQADARADGDRRPDRAERRPCLLAPLVRPRRRERACAFARSPAIKRSCASRASRTGCSSSWSTARFMPRATTGTRSSRRSWRSRPGSIRSAGSPAPTRTGNRGWSPPPSSALRFRRSLREVATLNHGDEMIYELTCFGDEEVTFRARLATSSAICGLELPYALEPRWMTGACSIDPRYLVHVDPKNTDDELYTSWAPDVSVRGPDPSTPRDELPVVEVTGQYDHPAAQDVPRGRPVRDAKRGPSRSRFDRPQLPATVRDHRRPRSRGLTDATNHLARPGSVPRAARLQPRGSGAVSAAVASARSRRHRSTARRRVHLPNPRRPYLPRRLSQSSAAVNIAIRQLRPRPRGRPPRAFEARRARTTRRSSSRSSRTASASWSSMARCWPRVMTGTRSSRSLMLTRPSGYPFGWVARRQGRGVMDRAGTVSSARRSRPTSRACFRCLDDAVLRDHVRRRPGHHLQGSTWS